MTHEFFEHRFFQTSSGNYVAESSDLGFRAGAEMPRYIVMIHSDRSRTVYAFIAADREDGEVVGWRYESTTTSAVLAVFND